MEKVRKTRKNPVPLVVETHPENYDGYPFITLIHYRNENFLTIIDNADRKTIKAFVLDLCGPTRVSEEHVINLAAEWYDDRRERFPISFEFSRLGVAEYMNQISRSFNIDFVTRVIGPLPAFEMTGTHKVKRRRRKPIAPSMTKKLTSG